VFKVNANSKDNRFGGRKHAIQLWEDIDGIFKDKTEKGNKDLAKI